MTLKKKLESREFYELMQTYRRMPQQEFSGVLKAITSIKKFLLAGPKRSCTNCYSHKLGKKAYVLCSACVRQDISTLELENSRLEKLVNYLSVELNYYTDLRKPEFLNSSTKSVVNTLETKAQSALSVVRGSVKIHNLNIIEDT